MKDKLLHLAGLGLLLATFARLVLRWPADQAAIPVHFTLTGQPTSTGSPAILLLVFLPAVALFLFLEKIPFNFGPFPAPTSINYPLAKLALLIPLATCIYAMTAHPGDPSLAGPLFPLLLILAPTGLLLLSFRYEAQTI